MSGPRFGVWAPVYGNHGARRHPQDAPDASYRRTRDLIVHAEKVGFDATLVAQHVIHPSDVEDDVLETWSTLAALAEATESIELIGAIKPLLFNPLVFAKVAANIADIAAGRLSINVVSGWFLPELEALGVAVLEHDDRYAHTRDWLRTVTALWAGKPGAGGCRAHLHLKDFGSSCDQQTVPGRLFCPEHCRAMGQKDTPVQIGPATMARRPTGTGRR